MHGWQIISKPEKKVLEYQLTVYLYQQQETT